MPLEQFSFFVRCDVNIPDVLIPAYPWVQLTSMESLSPELEALIDDCAKLSMINPDLVKLFCCKVW
jgi:hypothetical protein